VQVNLPGPRIQRLEITGIGPGSEPGYQTLLIGLASTGTALTRGYGTIRVTDDQRRESLNRSFVLDTFVPDTRIQYPVQVSGAALPAGRYRAVITIGYGNQRVARTLPFSITSKSLTRSFGSKRTTPPAATGQSRVLFIVAGLVLVLIGFVLGARVRGRSPGAKL
jgi:hypothetical protein